MSSNPTNIIISEQIIRLLNMKIFLQIFSILMKKCHLLWCMSILYIHKYEKGKTFYLANFNSEI